MPKHKAPKFGPVAPAAGGGKGSKSGSHSSSHSSHSKISGDGFTGGGGVY